MGSQDSINGPLREPADAGRHTVEHCPSGDCDQYGRCNDYVATLTRERDEALAKLAEVDHPCYCGSCHVPERYDEAMESLFQDRDNAIRKRDEAREQSAGWLANFQRACHERNALADQLDEARKALDRIHDMANVREDGLCGRPRGYAAIKACARAALEPPK